VVSFATVTEPKDISRQSESSLRGFWSLFVTQFQGAFSDNVLKNLVVFMLVALDVSLAEKHKIGELVTALFALPFILFSMAGGFLADRRSKRTMTIGVKIFEVFVVVTYGVANDLFFSGHTAIAVFGAIELARLGRRWLGVLGFGIALFEMAVVLTLRAHYTMDVFTGAVTALLVAGVAAKISPWCDRALAGLTGRKPGGADNAG
jgi:MFS family permease